MRVIHRDVFARLETVRQTLTGVSVVPNSHGFGSRLYECQWCGRTRFTRRGYPTAYRYGTRADSLSGYVSWHSGTFCSRGCHDAYHGA